MDKDIGPLLGKAHSLIPPEGDCPTPEELAALSEQTLPANDRDRLMLHISGCDRCAYVYAMLCAMPPEPEVAVTARPAPRKARYFVPLAAAAGLVLAVGVWFMLSGDRQDVVMTASVQIPEIKQPVEPQPESTPIIHPTKTPSSTKPTTPADGSVPIKKPAGLSQKPVAQPYTTTPASGTQIYAEPAKQELPQTERYAESPVKGSKFTGKVKSIDTNRREMTVAVGCMGRDITLKIDDEVISKKLKAGDVVNVILEKEGSYVAKKVHKTIVVNCGC